MIQIAPFRALRYNPARVPLISRVIAPPFDLVDADAAEELRQRDPYNVIRLTLGKVGPEGRAEGDYRRAAHTLAAWRREGILVAEDVPAVYVCEQTFTIDEARYVRRGLVCAMLLRDFASGDVLPHERTVSGPKADRLELMRACRANLSLVFGVFSDPQATIDALLAGMQEGRPLYEFGTQADTAYRVHRVTDPESIRELASLLRAERLFIADGHHRYETALRYRDETRNPARQAGTAAEDFLPIFCVSVENPGLLALPCHRLVRATGRFETSAFLAAVGRHFALEELPVCGPESLRKLVRSWQDTEDVIGCYLPGQRLLLLRPRPGSGLEALLPTHSAVLRRLPVTKLHYAVIAPHFGIPPEMDTAPPGLAYSHDPEEVFWGVTGARFDAGFLLPPIRPAMVDQVAQAGDKMPSKSTFFYPKIDSGLMVYPMDAGAGAPQLPFF